MTIVGIDLGTTNSLIGVWRRGRPTLIPNAHDHVLTPSVVGIDDTGEIVVGAVAKERLITHPDLTVAHFKRWMGSTRATHLGDHRFLPEELSALVLRSLVRDGEQFIKGTISEAVISVPAYFSDSQRKATKAAGQLAGLKVERIINEPTAAALAYGLNHKEDSSTLIFDLGGGTFDVSVLEHFDDVVEVHATAGDTYLGGEDFKGVLIDHLIQTHSLDLKAPSPHLAKEAEQIKTTLTSTLEAPYRCMVEGVEVSGTITRQEFEALAAPLVHRLRAPLEQAIRDSELSVSDIDQVILAGGATRMPIIRRVVGTLMQKLPLTHLNPDEIVALGAVVQAGLKARNEDLKDMVLTDVCPFTLGIDAMSSDEGFGDETIMVPILDRNATIPTCRSKQFSTVHALQRKVEIGIYQGESLNPVNNIKIGEIAITVPRGLSKHKVFDVSFTYDINGILEVSVRNEASGETTRQVINTLGVTLSEEEIARRLEALSHLKMAPWEQEQNRALLARAERLYEENTGDTRDMITTAIGEFRLTLNEQSLRPAEEVRLRERFSLFLDEVERPIF